jgi:hypothetical protein
MLTLRGAAAGYRTPGHSAEREIDPALPRTFSIEQSPARLMDVLEQ